LLHQATEGEASTGDTRQAKKQANLMDLQGLGREIWQGEEATAYVNRLRDDWG
jgi:hypothetical protein